MVQNILDSHCCRAIDLDMQGQIYLQILNFIMPGLTISINRKPLEQIPNAKASYTKTASLLRLFHGLRPLHVLIYLTCFTVPIVLRYQPSERIV